MDNNHNIIIYTVVGFIICVQLFFFLKNFKKIMAYKNIIASNKKLSVIELNIEEEKAITLDPEYFIENKRFFKTTEELEPEDLIEESDGSDLNQVEEDSSKYDSGKFDGVNEEYEDEYEEDEEEGNEKHSLFS